MLHRAESFAAVDPVTLHAMSWAHEVGVTAVGAGTGAALRLLVGAARAYAVVEVGTGTGVSGLWLLRGMHSRGVLTSIDVEPEHQAMARQSFAAAGFAASRSRLITGRARQVLARLADEAYDLVFVDGDIFDYQYCVQAAHRLLRLGGLVVVNNAFGFGTGAFGRELGEAEADAIAQVCADVRESPGWTPALLVAGTGLLCAVRS
jgi:predicted O-methyltransferase YrrM